MYDMLKAKVDRLAGKTYLVPKRHQKTTFSRRKKSASPHFGRTWRIHQVPRFIYHTYSYAQNKLPYDCSYSYTAPFCAVKPTCWRVIKLAIFQIPLWNNFPLLTNIPFFISPNLSLELRVSRLEAHRASRS